LRFYGRETGKLGLHYLSRGGIYLVGGLSNALSEKIRDP
jgi:glucokinase